MSVAASVWVPREIQFIYDWNIVNNVCQDARREEEVASKSVAEIATDRFSRYVKLHKCKGKRYSRVYSDGILYPLLLVTNKICHSYFVRRGGENNFPAKQKTQCFRHVLINNHGLSGDRQAASKHVDINFRLHQGRSVHHFH